MPGGMGGRIPGGMGGLIPGGIGGRMPGGGPPIPGGAPKKTGKKKDNVKVKVKVQKSFNICQLGRTRRF